MLCGVPFTVGLTDFNCYIKLAQYFSVFPINSLYWCKSIFLVSFYQQLKTIASTLKEQSKELVILTNTCTHSILNFILTLKQRTQLIDNYIRIIVGRNKSLAHLFLILYVCGILYQMMLRIHQVLTFLSKKRISFLCRIYDSFIFF